MRMAEGIGQWTAPRAGVASVYTTGAGNGNVKCEDGDRDGELGMGGSGPERLAVIDTARTKVRQ